MNLISINDLTESQIRFIVDGMGNYFAPAKLNGRTAIGFFSEPSTRTRISFAMAAAECGINYIDLDKTNSSISKGESLEDTFKTIELFGPDFLIIRHKNSAAALIAEDHFKGIIINAGTGTTHHPTQALGDATLLNSLHPDGFKSTIAIVGDIAHSRVASSLVDVFSVLGWDFLLCGPKELLLTHSFDKGYQQSSDPNDIDECEYVYVIRPQLERMEAEIFNIDEYRHKWQIKNLQKQQVLMHAGPVNVGLEVSAAALDHANLISAQVQAAHDVRIGLYNWLLRNT